jgi:hypothetical protein
LWAIVSYRSPAHDRSAASINACDRCDARDVAALRAPALGPGRAHLNALRTKQASSRKGPPHPSLSLVSSPLKQLLAFLQQRRSVFVYRSECLSLISCK